MTNMKRAICWAIALLAVAAAKRFGLIDPKMAQVLLLVFPVLAVAAIFGRDRCVRRERQA